MSSWSTVKAAIKAAAVSASGLAATSVSWARRAEAFSKQRVLLDVISSVQEMQARESRTEGSVTDFDVEVSYPVIFTVSFKCEHSQEDAQDLTENVRLGLQLPSVLETLSAAGVALVGIPMQPIPAPTKVDDRIESGYVFDVQFRAVMSRSDPAGQGRIDHVQGAGSLENPPGPAIAVPIDQ